MSLIELKIEIEKRLYYNDVSFTTKTKEIDGKSYLYFITKDQVGILTIVNAKAKYLIADSKKIEWALEEGFTEDQINKEFLVFELVRTLPVFIKKLSLKRTRKKTKTKKKLAKAKNRNSKNN